MGGNTKGKCRQLYQKRLQRKRCFVFVFLMMGEVVKNVFVIDPIERECEVGIQDTDCSCRHHRHFSKAKKERPNGWSWGPVDVLCQLILFTQ